MSDELTVWLKHTEHDMIRRRAHQLWLEEGCPNGKAESHWLKAELEIRAELNEFEYELKKAEYSVLKRFFDK